MPSVSRLRGRGCPGSAWRACIRAASCSGTALAAAQHAAEDAAHRVVAGRGTAAGAAEDAAQQVAHAAARGRLRLRPGACAGLPLRELLTDVGQHDGGQHRKQPLDQVAARGPATGQRRGDLIGVVAAEEAGDHLVALVLVELVDVDPAVEQVGLALGDDGLLQLDGVDVVGLNVFMQGAQEGRHQSLDGLGHLTLVGAELAGDIRHRDLVEEVIETGHVEVPLSQVELLRDDLLRQ